MHLVNICFDKLTWQFTILKFRITLHTKYTEEQKYADTFFQMCFLFHFCSFNLISNVCRKMCGLSVWYCQLIVVFLFRCVCLNSRSFATMWRCYWRRWMTWRRRAFSKFKHEVLHRVVNKTWCCLKIKKKYFSTIGVQSNDSVSKVT